MNNRPYLNLVSSGAMVFDGLQAVCWFVHMQSSVASPRFINIAPGQLYTLVFTQDATGNHSFTWPSNCINAIPLDPAPNAVTTQNVIGMTGSLLYANISGPWSAT
jgi:hypothetical protein